MITTHYDYGSYSMRPATNTFALFWLLCCFELCRPDLGLIFRRSLTWHLHISTLHHRAMSIDNALNKIINFLPRYSLLVLYRSYVLPIVVYGDIIFDNCTTTDSNLLESVQTAAAKIILGCLKTTSHEIILKDLEVLPHCLSVVSFTFLKPSVPSILDHVQRSYLPFAPKFFKNLSDYSSRFHTNVQLPSCKTHSLHNSLFHKGSKLWNSLPTHLHNLSSRQFAPKYLIYSLPKKTNAWHLHDCNTNATAILCMLRLGHSKLNIDGRYNQICQCGTIKTEVHMFLECPSTCASRRMLFANVSKILAEENVFSYSLLRVCCIESS